jgi:ribosomal protein S18 acetylase RimI-like enzyme
MDGGRQDPELEIRPVAGLSFREACREDVPAIQTLAGRIWRYYYPGIISRQQIEYMLGKMYSQDVLIPEMENGAVFLLAFSEGKPIGYLGYAYAASEKVLKLAKLYLLPEFQGRGAGRAMLDEARRRAEEAGAKAITLFVNKRNSKALRVYERYGFHIADSVVADIGGGFVMDDYRMELVLTA